MSETVKLKKLFDGLKKSIGQAANPQEMRFLGEQAVQIIVKRTRLGYGVDNGTRFSLKSIPWSDRYKRFRKIYKQLDSTTAPGKSNLTLTGQMLRSVKVLRAEGSTVIIGPQGRRDDGQNNEDIARYNAQRKRKFMELSVNEYGQLVRIYRRRFTGLLKRLAKVQ